MLDNVQIGDWVVVIKERLVLHSPFGTLPNPADMCCPGEAGRGVGGEVQLLLQLEDRDVVAADRPQSGVNTLLLPRQVDGREEILKKYKKSFQYFLVII